MEQQKFWSMQSTESLSKLAEWADEMDLEQIICPADDGHQRGGKRLTDLSIILPGSSVEDFVWTWYSECLLTDPVLELFKAEGFSGFEIKPVKAKYKKMKQTPPHLWELVVTGSAGMAPPESGIKLVKHCPACGLIRHSPCLYPEKLIEESRWDGSDFFRVFPVGYMFITNRVAETIRREHLAGSVIKPPSELKFGDHML